MREYMPPCTAQTKRFRTGYCSVLEFLLRTFRFRETNEVRHASPANRRLTFVFNKRVVENSFAYDWWKTVPGRHCFHRFNPIDSHGYLNP